MTDGATNKARSFAKYYEARSKTYAAKAKLIGLKEKLKEAEEKLKEAKLNEWYWTEELESWPEAKVHLID